MFTVKHINLIGEEALAQVATARFTPAGLGATQPIGQGAQPPAAPATLWVRDTEDSDERPLTGGTIFVMNSSGKTVARYDLGASPIPQTVRLDRFGRVQPEAA